MEAEAGLLNTAGSLPDAVEGSGPIVLRWLRTPKSSANRLGPTACVCISQVNILDPTPGGTGTTPEPNSFSPLSHEMEAPQCTCPTDSQHMPLTTPHSDTEPWAEEPSLPFCSDTKVNLEVPVWTMPEVTDPPHPLHMLYMLCARTDNWQH